MRQLAVCTTADLAGDLNLRLTGEIDLAVHAQLRRCLRAALAASANHLVVDLAGLTFLDGRGAVMLMDAAEHARRSGSALSFTGADSIVEQVLSIVAGWYPQAGAVGDGAATCR
ncbi:STAS domain-containing protein [Catellatospora sichuanensis]|uniref:STAS domain-containing protein n=1 Tax=Catellatospora sichuanensis TaxID=1969805 RepID=UPI00118328AE|nr:STAS domain-containing protein [Catellatospora sichuanensis]